MFKEVSDEICSEDHFIPDTAARRMVDPVMFEGPAGRDVPGGTDRDGTLSCADRPEL